MSRTDPRRGIAMGDVLMVLSVLALAVSLGYPRARRAALLSRVDHAAAQVQVVTDAVRRFQVERDRWPDPTDAGATPAEMVEFLPAGFTFDQGRYLLSLDAWETAAPPPPVELPGSPPGVPAEVPSDTVPPPRGIMFRSLVGVTVRSDWAPLLAGLVDRFGSDRSFLHDGAWTLVFASAPGR